jgi:AraC-like DNA-binding protein
MSLQIFDIAIRLMVIGQELLIAAVFVFSANERARAARIAGALLMLSIVGYLVTSSVQLRDHLPLLMPFMTLLALAVPYCVWLFARAIFEAPWPNSVVIYAAALVGVSAWSIHQSGMPPDTMLAKFAGGAMRIVGVVMVAHALWIAAKGRPDDLVERRRRFRLFFIAAISIQVIAVLIVELFWLGSEPPSWLSQTNVAIIAILTMGLALPLLRLSPEFFAVDEHPDSRFGPRVDTVLEGKLLELMDSGYFCETGLTIRALANRLRTPEHQLRRLINGHMGYRNFSAFLNSYRIAAAKQQLADAELAKKPVLTIALELGYASLGPFNRAFKELTGTTPTSFRRRTLDQDIADSE